jgi:hypothetical protein
MMTRRVNIDGKATRAAISEMAGKANGVKKICREKGLAPETVNQICRKGYGAPETINRCIEAGIPIIMTSHPIPCRRRKEHHRDDTGKKRARMYDPSAGVVWNEPEAVPLPYIPERRHQVTFEDLEMNPVKELLISHLTALIEDLKKI